MHDGTTTATQDHKKVNLFNKYFFSMLTSRRYCLPAMEDNTTIDAACTNIDISDSEVYEALAALDPSKSFSIDGIGTNVLKHGAQALYVPLHHLFNLSLTHCSIPSQWKIHQITPILKVGDRANIKNYRPISLLCCTSKVLERLIFDKIIGFVSKQISASQFGFMRHYYSSQQLLIFIREIINSFENKRNYNVIYLDFKNIRKCPAQRATTQVKVSRSMGKPLGMVRELPCIPSTMCSSKWFSIRTPPGDVWCPSREYSGVHYFSSFTSTTCL